MLRHDYSPYDRHVQNAVSDKLYNAILNEIAREFPWLATQCARDKEAHERNLPRKGSHNSWHLCLDSGGPG
jgi:hypothetical protein